MYFIFIAHFAFIGWKFVKHPTNIMVFGTQHTHTQTLTKKNIVQVGKYWRINKI
jgi:hypothetical protein